MNDNDEKLITSVHKVLGSEMTTGEFRMEQFSEETITRLRNLIKVAKERPLTPIERAELQAFRDAAFYMRKNSQDPE